MPDEYSGDPNTNFMTESKPLKYDSVYSFLTVDQQYSRSSPNHYSQKMRWSHVEWLNFEEKITYSIARLMTHDPNCSTVGGAIESISSRNAMLYGMRSEQSVRRVGSVQVNGSSYDHLNRFRNVKGNPRSTQSTCRGNVIWLVAMRRTVLGRCTFNLCRIQIKKYVSRLLETDVFWKFFTQSRFAKYGGIF